MPKTVVIDELHLTVRVRVPAGLPDALAVRTVLAGAEFMTRLRGAVWDAVRPSPELAVVRISLAR